MPETHRITGAPERKLSFSNWLKALLLSPGILFCAAYLALYLLTNVYLDRELKADIAEACVSMSGNRYSLSIERLSANPDLRSVRIENLELLPTGLPAGTPVGERIVIPERLISHIDLCDLFFSRKTAKRAAETISRSILGIDGGNFSGQLSGP
ncbi:hypothetical protein CHL67_03430 [Prosthecochloris sp. GSB1]|uniref:hypothetical protein n=1 Tax=Prosthecochloris sp. GSB1 TaxID=281093 RepID=UPI000B8CE5A0|nr:hypothetical protein [Prosthecochloris sp. GSB1]ASQ90102.1 hypothetical protein CHL67_03430 [Prosthecochloris sp. GSB1]